MTIFPNTFNKDEYINWHQEFFPQDNNFEAKLDSILSNLYTGQLENLRITGQALEVALRVGQREYLNEIRNSIQYQLPMAEKVVGVNESNLLNREDYLNLFKSKSSIIDKLWRKNKREQVVNLDNLTIHLSDIMRTEIIGPSLNSCQFLMRRINIDTISTYIQVNTELLEEFVNTVEEINFEPEMKMDSGYFAYHGEIKFKDGHRLELQIHSELSKSWKKLSHKVYEKNRLGTTEQRLEFSTTHSRLISLGHLLHLAECEFARLEKEIFSKESS